MSDTASQQEELVMDRSAITSHLMIGKETSEKHVLLPPLPMNWGQLVKKICAQVNSTRMIDSRPEHKR